jgi:membrane dipeptidase
MSIPVIDGHNDLLSRLYERGDTNGEAFFAGRDRGHIDLKRVREGNFAGGFFAVWIPPGPFRPDEKEPVNKDGKPELRLPPPVDLGHAQLAALSMMSILFRIEERSGGALKVVRTADELSECVRNGTIGAILHFEGAEAIDANLDALEVFYQAGLRSIGPVWSRPNAFAHGVPFAFPHSPDTGPGLTHAGRDLIQGCNRLGIMIDLSHLNEKGFRDVAALSTAPLVATHSNVHALCPATRNLTDYQLDAMRESDGLVGLNFANCFLRDDGEDHEDTPLEVMVRHVDYLVERMGIDGVGFGSDFDGVDIPEAISDVAGLPRLIDALRQHGYDDAALRKLAHENWIRVLRKTWK